MHFLVALALLEEERYWWFQMVDTCHHRSAVDWSHVCIPILSSNPRIIYWWTGCRTAYPSGWTFIYLLRGNRLQCFFYLRWMGTDVRYLLSLLQKLWQVIAEVVTIILPLIVPLYASLRYGMHQGFQWLESTKKIPLAWTNALLSD